MGKAYIAKSGSGTTTVWVVNTASNQIVDTIVGFADPRSVAASPAGRWIYVGGPGFTFGHGSVWTIKASTNQLVATLGGFSEPFALAVAPNGDLYVADESTGILTAVRNNAVLATTTVFGGLTAVAANPNGGFVYTANFSFNSVVVVDTGSHTVSATVAGFSGPFSMAITPNGALLYVGNFLGPVSGVQVMNTSSHVVSAAISGTGTDGISALVVLPNGQTVYATSQNNNAVVVIDTATNTVVTRISGFDAPVGIASTPDGKHVYVTNSGVSPNEVLVIDTATNTISDSISLLSGAFGIAIVPGGGTPTRQKPRDDNLGLGAVRQGPGKGRSSSVQNSNRQGTRGTYS